MMIDHHIGTRCATLSASLQPRPVRILGRKDSAEVGPEKADKMIGPAAAQPMAVVLRVRPLRR